MEARHDDPRLTSAVVAAGLRGAGHTRAGAAAPRGWHQSVTAITKVHTFGQKVAAVAVEYSDTVNPRTLDENVYARRTLLGASGPTYEDSSILRWLLSHIEP